MTKDNSSPSDAASTADGALPSVVEARPFVPTAAPSTLGPFLPPNHASGPAEGAAVGSRTLRDPDDEAFYTALGAVVLPLIEESMDPYKYLSQGELNEWKDR